MAKGHHFIIVAIDYFTKWVKAIPLKEVKQVHVIDFIEEHIILCYGIPELINVDQRKVFIRM